MALALATLLASAVSTRAASAQTPEQGAVRGAPDYQQGGVHLGAEGSMTSGGASVGAQADIRLDALVPVDGSGGDGRRAYVGPDGDGGGDVGGSSAGAPYRCRYVDTGRRSGTGMIEMARTCGTAARGGLGGGWYMTVETVYVDPADPSAPPEAVSEPLVDPAVLAFAARRSLRFPAPVVRSSPPVESGTVARLPTYFWVDDWAPVSESASAGPVTATVTATPLRQEWRIDDRLRGTTETVACDGPGGPPPDAERASAGGGGCVWVPEHSSAGQPGRGAADEPCFGVTVAVTWGVSWSSNVGGGGELGAGTSTADACLVVGEVQAVVTDAG